MFEDDLDEKEVAQQDSAHMRKVLDGMQKFFQKKLSSQMSRELSKQDS